MDVEQVGNCLVNQLEETVMGQQVDVGRPPDEAVHVFGRIDVEMNVDSVDNLVPQNVINHLPFQLAATVGAIVVLQTGRMPSHVAVFATTHEDDLPEIAEMTNLGHPKEQTLTWFFLVLHRELIQTLNLVHLTHEPEASADHRVHSVEISQVRSTQRHEKTHLFVEILQVLQGGSSNDSPHAVAYEVYHNFLWTVGTASDEALYLLCQLEPHQTYVTLSAHLVAGRHQVHSYRQGPGYFSFDQLHVVRARLKAVDEHHQHVALVVGEALVLGQTLFGEGLKCLIKGEGLEYLGFEIWGEVDLKESVVLIFLVGKQIFVDNFEFVYLSLLPHFGGNLQVGLLIPGLPAEDDIPKHSFPEEVLPLPSEDVLHRLQVYSPVAYLFADALHEIKVLLVYPVDLLNDGVFVYLLGEVVCDILKVFFVIDSHQLAILSERGSHLQLLLVVSEQSIDFCLEAGGVVPEIFDISFVEELSTIFAVLDVLLSPSHELSDVFYLLPLQLSCGISLYSSVGMKAVVGQHQEQRERE